MPKYTAEQKSRDRKILLSELKLQVKYIHEITQNDAIEEIHNAQELIKKLEAIA